MIAVDFFCGGGGMTRGLLNAGIQVLCGIDSNPACKKTYEENNHVRYMETDIIQLTPERLLAEYPELRGNDELLLVGCAPCQPFSVLRRNEFDHDGNPIPHKSINLLVEFGRFVKVLHPAHVLVENVPGLKGIGKEVLDEFKSMLKEEGYEYNDKIIYAKDYGVPQNRRRYILIASRLFSPLIPAPTHGNKAGLFPYKTVRETISHFPHINAGEADETVPNQRCANLKPILIERIMATPHNGGSRTDWPNNLVLKCHQ